MTTRGSAAVQGELWGARARDWAELHEHLHTPLYQAVLDAIEVGRATRLLDAGCGSGMAAALAAERGATVTGLDAAEALVALARQRLPRGDFHVGELEALPFPARSFTAVTSFNAVQFAADPAAALAELRRVASPGAPVAVSTWGRPQDCEMREVFAALRALLPPPPPGAPPPHPGALSEPGALAAVLERAGLRVVEEGEVACPFVFPSAEVSWRANASAGPNQLAIAHSGEAAVRAAFAEADRAHTRPDGSIRYENVFLWAAGERP
jgi:SAM-dependent methyltransferase